jgi:uncharacterized protein (TIGR00251 family)
LTARPWRAARAGLVVRVRVTPRSSHEAIEGLEATADGPALKVRVRAVPQDGAANAAVARLLAGWVGVPKQAVDLVAGGKSRIKSFAIAGDPAVLARALEHRTSSFQAEKDR